MRPLRRLARVGLYNSLCLTMVGTDEQARNEGNFFCVADDCTHFCLKFEWGVFLICPFAHRTVIVSGLIITE